MRQVEFGHPLFLKMGEGKNAPRNEERKTRPTAPIMRRTSSCERRSAGRLCIGGWGECLEWAGLTIRVMKERLRVRRVLKGKRADIALQD